MPWDVIHCQGQIGLIELQPGDILCDNDIGLMTPLMDGANIQGVAWDELLKDYLRAVDESTVPGISLRLLDANGFIVNTTTTDMTGQYQFQNVAPNQDYTIQAIIPAGISITSVQNQGADDTIDNDFNMTTQLTNVLSTLPNDTIFNVDLGLCVGYSIGNLVWHDLDLDGMYDGLEPVLPGVKVWLKDAITGVCLDSTITDSNGRYLFDGLDQGRYVIEVEILDQFKSTTDGNSASPNAADNDDNGIGLKNTGNVVSAELKDR